MFERYQRSEKALVAAMAELYGHSVSPRMVSNPVKKLDARYEKVRAEGVIQSRALRVDAEGRRQVLGVELANRESRSSWREFLLALKQRGLSGVEYVVSDDHAGLRRALEGVLSEAVWQRCYVHFLRNALDHMPRKRDDDCLQELRWLYHRLDQAAWLERWQGRYRALMGWVEEHIEETFTFYRLPLAHYKHMKSTNMLERFNGELRRRTRPGASSQLHQPSHRWPASPAPSLEPGPLLFFSLFQWILPNYSMNSSGRCSNWFTTAGEN